MEKFEISESQIRRAGTKDDGTWEDIQKQVKDLNRLMTATWKKRNQRHRLEEKQQKIGAIKSLNTSDPVWLITNNWRTPNPIEYGTKLKFIKAKIKYVLIDAGELGRWNVPFSWLSVTEPSEESVKSNRTMTKTLTKILSR